MIAVVGMSVRVPRASNLDELWGRVAQGTSCIDRFDDDPAELSVTDEHLMAHGTRVLAGGVLEGIEAFDAGFFGFSPADASILDPQHRLLLELVQHGLDDAAQPTSRREGTAVFAGCAMSSYLHDHLLRDLDLVDRIGAYPLMLGNDKDFLATRVSHRFGFGGPSITVQTACSTSLVAVHQAVASLLAGECDTAIAGGVTIRVPQRRGYLFQPDGILSVDGVCRPFDAEASGFVPSNGGAVVILRRLEDAIADGDPIRAVLRASAVNNDGASSPGFTAPSVEGQVRVLSEALALAELAPEDISYVETHGTATALGDIIEFEAIRRVYGAGTSPCYLGAAKANFGHTDTAAGALGLIKAVLSLERSAIPPLANFVRPNPRLGLQATRFRVPTELTVWEQGGADRYAAVTALGLGGTNAHVIVGAAPNPRPRRAGGVLLPISGHTEVAAATRADDITSAVRARPELGPGTALALAGEAHRSFRTVVDLEGDGQMTPLRQIVGERATLIWAFPGGGAQHPAMVASLVAEEPELAAALDEVLAIVEPLLGEPLRDVILGQGPDPASALRRPGLGLPALFCVQLATARVLTGWGIGPSAVIGHSAGEYVAACVAGVLEPEEAALLAVTRAKLFETAPPGAMVSLLMSEAEARACVGDGSNLEIAVVNGASELVVGGPLADVTALEAVLTESGTPFRRVPIDVAAHTSGVAAVARALDEVASAIPVRAAAIPWVSNLTGTWLTPDDLRDGYWGRHLRGQVRFADGMHTLLAGPPAVIVDMGPAQVLRASIERDAPPATVRVVPVFPHPRSGSSPRHLRRAVADLWAAGADVDLMRIDPRPEVTRVPLPPYPFERTRCWVDDGQPLREVRRSGWRTFRPVLEPARPDAAPWGGAAPSWRCTDEGDPRAARIRTALARHGARVRGWSDTEPEGSGSEPAAFLVICGSDPIAAHHRITQAAKELAVHRGSKVLVVVSDADDPVSGLARSLVRVIRSEYPELVARSIETQLTDDALELLANELGGTAEGDAVLIGGRRYVRELRELTSQVRVPAPPLRAGGVWIITGGLGAIGRTLAVHLAGTVQGRVVLVARSLEGDHPAEAHLRHAALDAITSGGGQYELVLGDIAEAATAREAVARAEQVFGGLHGVIHAAGVPSGGVIELRSEADANAVLRPKIAGLRALDAALGARSLDAFVLCSALDAQLGTPGQAEHCAANGYLDAYAELSVGHRGLIAIGWSAWREIGQAARADVPLAFRAWRDEMLANALTPLDGCAVFDAAVAWGGAQIVVATEDPNWLAHAAREASLPDPPMQPADVDELLLDPSLESPVERIVGRLWMEVLGTPVVRIDDDFFALGGHSLLAMQLVTRLREIFDLPVALPDLLERPTVRDQAGHVEGLLVALIERLDDDEVLRRLDALKQGDDEWSV